MGVINYRNLANSQALAANLANSPTIRSLDITLILIGPTDSGGWSYRTHVRPSFRPSVCSSVRSFFSKTGYRIFPKLDIMLQAHNGDKLIKPDLTGKIQLGGKSTKTSQNKSFLRIYRSTIQIVSPGKKLTKNIFS